MYSKSPCSGLLRYVLHLPLAARQSPRELIKGAVVQNVLREVEKTLGTEGRVVLRPSGTEPVIRVMVEGRDQSVVASLGQQLAEAVVAIETGT